MHAQADLFQMSSPERLTALENICIPAAERGSASRYTFLPRAYYSSHSGSKTYSVPCCLCSAVICLSVVAIGTRAACTATCSDACPTRRRRGKTLALHLQQILP